MSYHYPSALCVREVLQSSAFVCLSICPHLVNALSHQCLGGEGDMLPNYAPSGGLEVYQRGVT